MSADQTAAELTTRDVLSQVDRRLSLIEEDLRSLDEKLDDKVDGLDAKLDHKIDGLRSEMNAQFGALRSEMNAQNTSLRSDLGARLDANLKWTIGTLVALTGLVAAVFKL